MRVEETITLAILSTALFFEYIEPTKNIGFMRSIRAYMYISQK